MLIQMLVENAIKHGISNLKKGGIIELNTSVQKNSLLIKISNSGTLNYNTNSTEIGLKNIKKRLHLLYGKNAIFNLTEENNTVIASIKIPLK
jgi:LytS/YehU family sensor histidine kinase